MTTYYNHMIDMAFSVITLHEEYQDIPVAEIISALQKRIAEIHAFEFKEPNSTIECFGSCSDTYEMTEDEAKKRTSLFHY